MIKIFYWGFQIHSRKRYSIYGKSFDILPGENRDTPLNAQIGKFPNGQLMIYQVLIQIGIRYYLSSRVELVDYLNGELSHDNHIWFQM